MGRFFKYPVRGFSTHQNFGLKWSMMSITLQTKASAFEKSLGAVVFAIEYSAQGTLAAITLNVPGG